MSRHAPDGTDETDDATWLFGLFALLFALSLILHQLWWDGFEVRSWHFLVVLAALWVAVRPTSVVRFLTMIAFEVVAVALDMPEVGSHTLLVLIMGVCLLTYLGWTTVLHQRVPDAGVLFERIAPFLRVQILTVYVFAAVAKINTGFLDADMSCAAFMSRQIAWFHPTFLDGPWRILPSIWGTVLVEFTLPVLLTVPRTRMVGLVVGGIFHAVLALAGNVPFSSLALAFYAVFLPADAPTRLRARVAGRRSLSRWIGQARRWGGSLGGLCLTVILWLAGAVAFPLDSGTRPAVVSYGTRIVLLGVIAGWILLCLGVTARGSEDQPLGFLRLGHPVFFVGVLLLAVNGLSPYLGLKTESSFTMFSNLYTEEGSWNHLLIPEAVRLFSYQDDLVRISGSNDRALAGRTEDGTRLVRYELERYLRSHPGTRADYATTAAGAETVRTAGHHDGPALLTPVLDKLFKFQAVPPPTRGGCGR